MFIDGGRNFFKVSYSVAPVNLGKLSSLAKLLILAETVASINTHGSKHISSLSDKIFVKILTDYRHDNVGTKVVGFFQSYVTPL
jgi:hypothetical protein